MIETATSRWGIHRMVVSFGKHWHDFKARAPGRRFQDIHRVKAKNGGAGRHTKRILIMLAGAVISAIGVFLLAVPGPGLLVLAIGLILIAGESITMARILDWLELKLRALFKAAIRFWRHSSTLLRGALITTGALLIAAVAAALIILFFR